MADLVASYFVPSNKDPDVFAAVMYQMQDSIAPAVTGNMKSYTEYEVDGGFIWFWNECIYAPYQNYVTSNAGWWEDSLDYGYSRALDLVPDLDDDSEIGGYFDESV